MSRFLESSAPMTAKCIMRDHIMLASGCRAESAEVTAANIICEMLAWGFEIKDVYPRNYAMAQQDDEVKP